MNVEEFAKLIQIYMYQGMYSNNGTTDGSQSDTSGMFEVTLTNALQSLLSEGGLGSSLSQVQDPLTGNDAGNDNTGNSKNVSDNILGAIDRAAEKYGVEKDFLKAVINQESSFNPQAVSKAGAEGLMQLMPSTAKSLGVENPFDVLENVDGGTRYLKKLIDSFDGNKELALSAYNGGIGRMNKLGVDTVEEINKMPGETKNYVSRVMNIYNNYKKL